MNTKYLIMTIFILMTAFSTRAQVEDNYLLQLGSAKLGGYIGGSGSVTGLDGEIAGFISFKGAVIFESGWGVGVYFSGLQYDKHFGDAATGGTYHLYAGYSGVFVEKMFVISDNFNISLTLATGMGEVSYKYDRDYRKDKIWYEEVLDKSELYVFEPGTEVHYKICENMWLGLSGSYRNTSPLTMKDAPEGLLRSFSGGLSFKWGVF